MKIVKIGLAIVCSTLLIVPFFIESGVSGCGGNKPAQRVGVSGLLKYPKKKPKSPTKKTTLAGLKLESLQSTKVTNVEDIATQGQCVLLDHNLKTITSIETSENGSFTFLVMDTSLAINDTTLAYYIRCSTTNSDGSQSIQMSTLLQSRNGLTPGSSSAALSFATAPSVNVDTAHTTETLLVYQGSNVNPLKASTAPVIAANRIEAIHNAVTSVNNHNQSGISGTKLDATIARLEQEVSTINSEGSKLSDGTSPGDAIHALFNADGKTDSALLTALGETLSGDTSVTTKNILGDSEAGRALSLSFDVLIKNASYNSLPDQTKELLHGALMTNGPTEIVANLSNINFISTISTLADSLKTPSEGGSVSLTTLQGMLGNFLQPELIAKIIKTSGLSDLIGSVINKLLTNNFDPDSKVVDFIVQGIEESSNVPNENAIDNTITLLVNNSDKLDTDPSDGKVTNAGTFIDAVIAQGNAQNIDRIISNASSSFNSKSCKKSDGGNYCIDSNPNLECSCDILTCQNLGTCCEDATSTCTTDSLNTFLENNGQGGEQPLVNPTDVASSGETGSTSTTGSGGGSETTPAISQVTLGAATDSTDTFPAIATGDSITLNSDGSQLMIFQITNIPDDPTISTQTCVFCSNDNTTFNEMNCDSQIDSSINLVSSKMTDNKTQCFTDATSSSSLVYFRVSYKGVDSSIISSTNSVNFTVTIP